MSEPLAERMRPQSLDDYVGQDHLVGRDGVLRRMIESGHVSSFILWGPPGVGKTTLAHIIASTLKVPFYTLSAVTSGVKDVRDVIAKAKQGRFFQEQSPILFIDEIHRFSKSQQDSLLGAVEQGVVTLIGATTENPSFEVIRPLLSRCQLYVLKSLGKDDLLKILHRALTKDAVLSQRHIELKETGALLRYSGGDARKLLNILDLVVGANDTSDIVITDALVEDRLQTNPLAYDKEGEMHYDIISAFINALLLANAAFDAVMKIGWPEGRIPLAEATVYLAASPKSNSAYMGINTALEEVRKSGNQPVPLPLRNAPTKLMAELGYHDGYKYPHDYPGNFTPQQYLPDELKGLRFWHAQHSPSEEKLYQRMLSCWGDRYKE